MLVSPLKQNLSVFEDPLQVGGYSRIPQNSSDWRNDVNRQNSRSLNRNTNQNNLQYQQQFQQQDPRQQQARLGYPSVN